ncbi:MAG: 2-polyprenyl-3-methyl-6-methoxy-1,4-benzoquinone monooxygenase, partial [Nevskiaceae bacterium]
EGIEAPELDEAARRHAAGLMRVNHAGEVAAQALYQGHALVARDLQIREHMLKAAAEERSHLAWCEERLRELDSGPSRLDPLWYAGSFAIGAIAGLAGDRWSLGFVEETEKQVSEHLSGHLDKLPEEDARSRAIVEAMRADEERHGREAVEAGAQRVPRPVQELMRAVARVMTRSAYWL